MERGPRHRTTNLVDSVSAEARAFGLAPVPDEALCLFGAWCASPRLIAHLYLVHDVASQLTAALRRSFPKVLIDVETVRFGAVIHDLGKAMHPSELTAPGKLHEVAGEARLLEEGIPVSRARFARTHGLPADSPGLELEDLVVMTADKIWKGRRLDTLEERLTETLSAAAECEFWSAWPVVSALLDSLAEGSDARLTWQARFGLEVSR